MAEKMTSFLREREKKGQVDFVKDGDINCSDGVDKFSGRLYVTQTAVTLIKIYLNYMRIFF